jgi:dinuclear metal center YbgI/SA1388 family protein
MITLQELCCYLDNLLKIAYFKDYGPNGLQIEGESTISRIVTGVSADLETIQAAVKNEAQVLIVHHGLFWERESGLITGVRKEKIQLLLENGMSLIAYHLPLDAHSEYGNNWKAAQDMNWKNLEPFGVVNGIPIGVKGAIAKIPREALKQKLEVYYNHPAYYAFGGKSDIESCALISGGAHKNLKDAITAGVDCFITGSHDEPIWSMAKEEKINFFALGHSATERVGPKALAEHLHATFALPCEFIDIFNPF